MIDGVLSPAAIAAAQRHIAALEVGARGRTTHSPLHHPSAQPASEPAFETS